MSWLDKVTRDPRPLYVITLIVLVFPLIRPIALPIPISDWTRGIYNFIEDMDPEERILLTGHWGYRYGELYPQFLAVMEHCAQKGIKVVILDGSPQTPTYTDVAFKELSIPERLEYGVDYVELGYIPGGEVMIAGLCADFHAIAINDYFGTPLTELDITKDVKDITDFAGVIVFTGSADSQSWLNQAYAPYGVPVGHSLYAAKVVDSEAYFRAGDLFGIINGMRGAAEYELLINRPAVGASMMGSASLVHMLVIFALALGAIAFLQQKMSGGVVK